MDIELTKCRDVYQLALLRMSGIKPIKEEIQDGRYFATYDKKAVAMAIKALNSSPMKEFKDAYEQVRKRIIEMKEGL